MKKYVLLPLMAGFIIIGATSCASMEAQSAISDAQAEIDKAKAMGFEWRDSKKMLKKASKAIEEGNLEEAAKITAKAKRQGELAQMQAKDQMNVSGPH